MPILKVWCLPKKGKHNLNLLSNDIVDSVLKIRELGLKRGNAITVLFPADLRENTFANEIIVEVSGLFVGSKRTIQVKQSLAKSVGETLKKHYPQVKVECFVYTFDPALQGFWKSEE